MPVGVGVGAGTGVPAGDGAAGAGAAAPDGAGPEPTSGTPAAEPLATSIPHSTDSTASSGSAYARQPQARTNRRTGPRGGALDRDANASGRRSAASGSSRARSGPSGVRRATRSYGGANRSVRLACRPRPAPVRPACPPGRADPPATGPGATAPPGRPAVGPRAPASPGRPADDGPAAGPLAPVAPWRGPRATGRARVTAKRITQVPAAAPIAARRRRPAQPGPGARRCQAASSISPSTARAVVSGASSWATWPVSGSTSSRAPG